MKKKMVLGVVLVLLVQGTLLYAEFWGEFRDYARQKNWNRMERVLRNNRNKITNLDRQMCLYAVIDNLRGEEAIRGFELLRSYNINPDDDLFLGMAFEHSQPDNVIDYLLTRGIAISVYALKEALQKRRFSYVSRMLPMIETTNLDYRTTRANWTGSPDGYKAEYSWTALIYAVQAEHIDTVRRLVERGANVNLRAEDGATAASMAYDNGLMDIYNYLKANGAVDFEPRQTTQQPSAPAQSTTNVYVQPSAPVQPAPAPATPAAPRLSPGFYSDRSVSGSQINLTMVYSNATNATGTALHSINRANNSQGTLTISGNQMVINWYSGPLSGVRTVYTINSSNQFSGPGETWRM
jgi:hypothetical protein